MHRRGAVIVTVKSWFFVFLLLLLHLPQSVFGFATSKRTAGKKQQQQKQQEAFRGFGKPTAPSWQQVAEKCGKKNTPLPFEACPCGGGAIGSKTTTAGIDDDNKNINNNIVSYTECCAPYHRGDAYPETPRKLLQSRYSAFVIRDIRYIIETTHPTNGDWREDKVAWVKEMDSSMFDNHDFVALHVEEEEVKSDTEAYITFTVRLRGKEGSEFYDTKQERIIRERSKFLKDNKDGRWLYTSGELSIVQE
ncbi:hypothetical protein MHU86_15246 [Fragilaria crotonensis]|nr:hypothetical protein MHU86_15246 [Fragilaria crotonensis]